MPGNTSLLTKPTVSRTKSHLLLKSSVSSSQEIGCLLRELHSRTIFTSFGHFSTFCFQMSLETLKPLINGFRLVMKLKTLLFSSFTRSYDHFCSVESKQMLRKLC